MSVIFRGGTSGNRADALPPVPSSGVAQPVLNTATHGSNPNVHFQAQEFSRDHFEHATPDFMPSGGTVPSGSDITDPGATGSDSTPAAIFPNASGDKASGN